MNHISLNNTATSVSGITVDIDSTLRTVTPDIGAKEYVPCSNDAGIDQVNVPSSPLLPGVQNIHVILRNQGTQVLTSTSIRWEVNGILQPNFGWTGSLASGDSLDVIVGVYNFQFQNTIPHSIRSWTANPNNVSDCNNYNDTSATEYVTVSVVLCGTYTIGGLNPDFVNFTQAANALNLFGISCPVIFKVRDGNYGESITINAITGSSSVNTVTFESESGDSSLVILSRITLSGAQNVILKKIRINGTSSVSLATGAGNIWINNCWLSPGVGSGVTMSSLNGSVYIRKNNIQGGISCSAGVYQELVIEENIINSNNTSVSVTLIPTGLLLKVINNQITTLSSIGISLTGTGGTAYVRNNEISGTGSTGISSTASASTIEVTGNKINTVTSGISTSSANILVANNFVQATSVGISSTANGGKIVFNSVNVTGVTGTTRAMEIGGTSAQTVKNNIFANNGNGYAVYRNSATIPSGSDWDFNDYYSQLGFLGFYNSTNQLSLANWRSTTNRDANSKDLDPYYLSSTELRTYNRILNGAGVAAASVLLDIDGQIRNQSAPDIGADEFLIDFGITRFISPTLDCNQSVAEPVTINIAQFGDIPFIDLIVAYQVNSGTIFTDTIPGAINNDILYTFQNTQNLSVQGTYNFKAWLVNANDDNINNDTLRAVRYRQPSPVVDFTFATQCAGLPVQFTSSSSVTPGFINNYEWSFGDGQTDTAANPIHRYDSSGVFFVTFYAYSNEGCFSSIVKSITILPTPKARFISADICLGESLQLINNSTVSSGTLTYAWDFGNGTNSTSTNPTATYPLAGDYRIQLVATNSNGCRDTIFNDISVNPLPIVSLPAINSLCSNSEPFRIDGGQPQGGLYSGPFMTDRFFDPQASGSGDFVITYSFTDSVGCLGSASQTIHVDEVPNATISADGSTTFCSGGNVILRANAGYSYQWQLNGIDISGANFDNLSVTIPGEYTCLVSNGTCSQLSNPIQIFIPGISQPIITASGPTNFCQGNSVTLTAINASSYIWSTGSTASSISVTPTQTTSYSVTVTIGSSSCSGSITVNIVNLVTDIFIPDTIFSCGEPVVVDAGSGFSTYAWNNGETTPTITQLTSGWCICNVTQGGCSTTDSVYVNIINANILQNDTTICLGASLNLSSNNALFLSGTPNPGLGGYATVSNVSSILPTGSAKTYEVAFRLNQSVPSGNNMGLWAFGPDPLQDCKAFGLKISSSQCGSNKLWLWGHNCPEFCGPTVQTNHDYKCLVVVSANNVKLYLNGILEMDVTMNLAGVISDNYFIGLGWDSYNFQGYIDDVRIWDFPWAQTDVTNAYNSCIYPDNSNLISGWDFNQPSLNEVMNIKSNIDDIDFSVNCSLQSYSSGTNCVSSGTYSYLWSDGSTTSNISVTPTQTTTYYLTFSNGSISCTDSVIITVNNNTADLFVQDTISACSDSTILDAGVGFNDYLWSTGETTQILTVHYTGWYKCIVNQSSCTSADSVFVNLIHANITQDDTTIIGGNLVDLNVEVLSSDFIEMFSLITKLGDSSYYISNNNYSWFEARDIAINYLGHLATLTSYQEDTAVSNRINYLYSNLLFPLNNNGNNGECFIGLFQDVNSPTYSEPNGGWQWITGELYSYTDWYPGEPNNNSLNSEYGTTNWNNTKQWNDKGPADGGVNGGPGQFIFERSDPHTTVLWSTGETTEQIIVNPCETTTYYVTVSNGIGSCIDSVTVIVSPTIPSLTESTICQGQTYLFNGVNYSVGGTYSATLSNANGCDSIATLILQVDEAHESVTTLSECESYTWNGQTYTQSGIYYYTVPLSSGCDSVATLNLTINHESSSSSFITACESYTWNGQTYNQSGTFTYFGTNVSGCDSIATLTLTINHSTTSLTTIITCGNYTWNGQTYSSSGVYQYSSINSSGCDSTATLNLTINSLSVSAVSINASATVISPGNTVTLSVNGGSLGTAASWKWYSGSCSGVFVGTGNSISVSPNTTTTYFVQAQGTCNTTNCVSVVINVNSIICGPTGIISNAVNNTICRGSIVRLTVQGSLTSGASWKWYKGNCGSHSSIGSGNSINVSPSSTTTYYVRSQGGSCGTTACVSIIITVLSSPSTPGSISGISSGLCNRTGVIYSVNSVSGATSYVWSVPVGATITAGQGSNSIVVNFGTSLGTNSSCGSRSVCVKAVNACGSSALRCISISLIPTISCSISGPSTVCRNQVVSYSITASSYASSYSWVVPLGWTILSGQGTLSISVRVGNSSGTVRVTASNTCGVSTAVTKYVTKRSCSREEDENNDLVPEISLYPNPVSGHLFLDPGGYQPQRMEIFDLLGNVLDRMEWKNDIDFSGYQSGLYFIRIYTDDLVILKKVQVTH